MAKLFEDSGDASSSHARSQKLNANCNRLASVLRIADKAGGLGRMRFLQRALCLSVLVAFPGSGAESACQGQIAGPVGSSSKYYYSSSCFGMSNRTVLRNQVCSVSKSPLVFKWSKLNWVSGASGVEFGNCLVRRNFYDSVIKVRGSTIQTNAGSPEDTDVYLPDLGAQGNKPYFDTIEGGGPRVEEGEREPFYFYIEYDPRLTSHSVHIHATMVGERPVFYLILPSSIKNSSDLNSYISNDDLKKIAPLVRFDNIMKKTKLGKNDTEIYDFLDNNKSAERGVLPVDGEKVADIEFSVDGELSATVNGLAICAGQGDYLATCYAGSAK